MLVLQPEQLEALERLERERLALALAKDLGGLWPAVVARIGERQLEFVAAALVAAEREGLRTPVLAAGLLNLWCVWGPAFETRPGFEWARAILDASARSPTVRMHQLVHATRERLQRPPAGGEPPVVSGATLAQFDAAIGALPTLIGAAAGRGVFVVPAGVEAAPVACDLASIDLAVTGTDWRQEYHRVEGGWRRQPATPALARQRIDTPLAQPLRVVALGPPARGLPASQLQLRLQPQAQCDVARHPALTLDSSQGRLQRRGREALVLTQPLLGPPSPTSAAAVIAAEAEPLHLGLEIETCGVRDAGEPIGPVAIDVRVYPCAQTLLECRVPSGTALVLPSRGAAAGLASSACRLECDGEARDARAWVGAWQGLQQQVGQGLEKLLNAWAREAGLDNARLEATVSALAGTSVLTWGYREEDSASAFMRIEGQLDLMACSVDLTMTGELVDGGARARLRLRVQGHSELRGALARVSAAVALDAALEPAAVKWRFPLVVEVEPAASPDMMSLVAAGPALPGAIVGSAGLRGRADGGCEWFFSLRLEPTSIGTSRLDPVTGVSSRSRALLPALSLVEWSSS
jgi:hypothetical protein